MLYRRPYDPRHRVVCFDEKSLQLLADPACYPIRAVRPQHPRRQDYEYVRHATRNIFLWVEPQVGYRHTLVYDKFGVLEGSLELDDWPGVEAMHRANSFDYQGGPYKGPYVDLCAFHDEDSDLFGSLMESEHAHFTAA